MQSEHGEKRNLVSAEILLLSETTVPWSECSYNARATDVSLRSIFHNALFYYSLLTHKSSALFFLQLSQPTESNLADWLPGLLPKSLSCVVFRVWHSHFYHSLIASREGNQVPFILIQQKQFCFGFFISSTWFFSVVDKCSRKASHYLLTSTAIVHILLCLWYWHF